MILEKIICKQSKLRVNLILHRFDCLILYVHLKNSIAIMVLDHSTLGLENKTSRIFCVRQVYFTKSWQHWSLGTCKPTFHTFYTSHLRWNSTMRHCFYHTDHGQNVVFHNFVIQIALIQYSGRSKHALVKKNSKITYTASQFSLLTSAKVDCLN